MIPPHAYGPALIIVGLLMLEPIRNIPFHDYTELVPVFITIVLMVFTLNIGTGMTAGFASYPLFKLLTGRGREVHAGMWVLSGLSLLFLQLLRIEGRPPVPLLSAQKRRRAEAEKN